MYESGAQIRGPDRKSKFIVIHDQMMFEASLQYEITKGDADKKETKSTE